MGKIEIPYIIWKPLKNIKYSIQSYSIGLAVAKQLVADGASIMISSRKSHNVEKALEQLKTEFGVDKVNGVVCHVSKKDDRTNLIQEVGIWYYYFLCWNNPF